MRALFVMSRAPGHLYPMVPLAWALQAAGHQVRIAGLPGSLPSVSRTGLTAVSVGADLAPAKQGAAPAIPTWHEQVDWPVDWPSHPQSLAPAQWQLLAKLAGRQVGLAEAMLDDLLAYGREWRPDVVIHDAVCYAGAVLGAALGVPVFSHSWGRATAMRIEMSDLDSAPLESYLGLFRKVGAPERITPDGRVDPCPPSMLLPESAAAAPRLPIRFIPFNGPGTDEPWLREQPRRPRVAITGGVSAGDVSPQALPGFFDRTVRAATKVDAEIILAIGSGQTQLLGPVPDGVRVVEAMPFNLLFPTCDLVIHQGSGGTMLTTAHAGVPQLVLPLRPEQQLSGDRLAAVGAGRQHVYNHLAARDDAVEVLTEDIDALLTDGSYRSAALALQADMQTAPPPSAVAAQIEAVVG